jgi:LysM domain-containing protein
VTGSSTSRPWVRFILAFTLALAWVAPTHAQEKPPERREHVVKAGDTLWDLARIYLSNPYLWPLIYEANREIVQNPHRIFPAEKLVIPPLPGEKPVVQPQAVASAEPKVVPAATNARRTRFYSPKDTGSTATLITAEELKRRRVQPAEYYATPWLGDSSSLQVLGFVFKPDDFRREQDKMPQVFFPFDRMHIAYHGKTRPKVGDMLLVVSLGREVKGYGRVIEPTGVVRVENMSSTTMEAMVTHQFGNLQTNNIVIPMDSFPNLDRDPVPANGPEGRIIAFHVPQPLYGDEDRAFISLGANSGVKVGDELIALLPERQPDNKPYRLPAETIARMIVTRVAGQSATARIIHLDQPALEMGLPVRVVMRMP